MRYAKGLHPVWGLLAPPQSFTRNIRIAIIAAVLVATAGSFSLIDRSHDETSVAARTLLTQQPNSNPLGAQVKSRSIIQSDPTKPALLASRTDPRYGARAKEGEQDAPSRTALCVTWTPVQFFERWLVPCCRALAPLATNTCILGSQRTQTLAEGLIFELLLRVKYPLV